MTVEGDRPAVPPPVGRCTWLALLGVAVVLVGTFLPWLRSGIVWRNSYEVWQSADRLGVVSGGVGRALLVSWFLLVIAAGAAVLAVGVHRPRVALAITAPIAVVAVVSALLALSAPLPTGPGPTVTLLGGLVASGAVGVELALSIRRRNGRRSAEDP